MCVIQPLSVIYNIPIAVVLNASSTATIVAECALIDDVMRDWVIFRAVERILSKQREALVHQLAIAVVSKTPSKRHVVQNTPFPAISESTQIQNLPLVLVDIDRHLTSVLLNVVCGYHALYSLVSNDKHPVLPAMALLQVDDGIFVGDGYCW